VEMENLRESAQGEVRVETDESKGEPLRRREADLPDHALRHTLEFVIDGPHLPDKLEHRIGRPVHIAGIASRHRISASSGYDELFRVL
jgi:hypothetical protein